MSSTRPSRKRKAEEAVPDQVAPAAKKAKKSSQPTHPKPKHPALQLKTRLDVHHSFVAASGSNEMLQLGFERSESPIPRPVVNLQDVRVFDIKSGGAANVAAVEKDGGRKVFTWGCNDSGTLGRATEKGNDEQQIKPYEVPLFNGKEVVQLSVGDAHMAALLSDGSVYNWGVYRDANGILGFTAGQANEQLEPKKVELGTELVTQIASAENATLALTQAGHIYIWGAYRLQWRTSERTRAKVSALFPTQVLTTTKFNHIAAGGMHFFARSVDGKWYSWGLNNWGQLGHGHAPAELEQEEALQAQDANGAAAPPPTENHSHQEGVNYVASPKLIQFPENAGRVIAVEGGQHHSLALTDTGVVLGFGRNSYGQLGWGKAPSYAHTPTPIAFFNNLAGGDKAVQIACGGHQSFVLTQKKEAFAFGFNAQGQLGVDSEDDKYHPEPLTRSAGAVTKELFFSHFVGGGSQHNVLLLAPLPGQQPKVAAAAAAAPAPAVN